MLTKSGLTDYLINLNNLAVPDFTTWEFTPGMLFNQPQKWWTGNENRPAPHEGVDFHLYKNVSGQIRHLPTSTKIPALFAGSVVQICDDFLGKSIFVCGNHTDARGSRLHTIYAHITPYDHIEIGAQIKETDIIAVIADSANKHPKIPPHLHISTLLLPKSTPRNRLNWKTLTGSDLYHFCDPMEFINA